MQKKEPDKSESRSTGNNRPPEPDEVEVSIFGTGYGESILLHLHNNNWIIVDSCENRQTKKIYPLSYLEEANLEPSLCVKKIIATHWHDDHIRGLGNTVQICKSAQFVCSDALDSDDFFTLLAAVNEQDRITEKKGLAEFYNVITAIQNRRNENNNLHIPIFAKANLTLWSGTSDSSDEDLSIWSLSPSDNAVFHSRKLLCELVPSEKESKISIRPLKPNHTAVVLLVTAGDYSILLGSDLEENSTVERGWTTLITNNLYRERRSFLFKVPHHGSQNAHHEPVWSDMLYPDPIAVMTSFQKGKVELPTGKDKKRLCTLTNRAYITSDLQAKMKKRTTTVDKMISSTVKSIRMKNDSWGQVRVRFKLNGELNIETFGAAKCLNTV